jgi:hypothetical protein
MPYPFVTKDNAGPHVDAIYKKWLQENFDSRGWKLGHQGPQGPYTNVLDLQISPAVSKRHSEILSLYSNVEANADNKIWKVRSAVGMVVMDEFND